MIRGIKQRRNIDDVREKVGTEGLQGGKPPGSDAGNQIRTRGKTDGGVRSFPGGDGEAAGGYHLCGFEGVTQKRKKSFNVVNNVPYFQRGLVHLFLKRSAKATTGFTKARLTRSLKACCP